MTARTSRALIVGIASLTVWLAFAATVAAHAELVSSSPAAGGTVESAPGMSVVLTFSETLKSGSEADVVGPGGAVAGTATIDPADDARLSWTAPAPLPPGAYTIRWTSIATDGDVQRGTIPFTVTAAAAPTAASASPSPALSPSAPPSPSPTPAGDTESTIGPVVAALVAVAVLALSLVRRRGRPGR